MWLWSAVALALAIGLAAGTAAAQTTYVYSGSPYATFTNVTTCEAGPCADFMPGMRISGSFQTAAPLAPNLSSADIAPQITTFDFSHGLTVFDRADPNVRLIRANATTDAAGAITALEFTLQRWLTATPAAQCETVGACNPGPPLGVVIQPYTNPNTKFDGIQIRTSQPSAYGERNKTCVERGTAPSGEVNSCLLFVTTDPGDSRADSMLQLPLGAPAPVPTLSEWAMILFGTLLAGGAALMVQRRRMTV